MGLSTPQSASPGAQSAMVARRSVALLVLVLAVTLALPLVRGACDGGPHPPNGAYPRDGAPKEDYEWCKKEGCNYFIPPNECSCYHPPNECLGEVCDFYRHDPNCETPDYCKIPPGSFFALAAQIALGAALVVAIAALINVVLRACSNRRPRGRQRRPQMRTSAGSTTSAEVYFNERLQDCPPCYDDISWEKPPSYCNLQNIEGSFADGTVRQNPPASPSGASQSGEPQETRPPASPPPYGGVYTVSQHVLHLQSPPVDSGEERGIIFTATSNNEGLAKDESSDEPSKSAETKVEMPEAVSH